MANVPWIHPHRNAVEYTEKRSDSVPVCFGVWGNVGRSAELSAVLRSTHWPRPVDLGPSICG